MKKMIMLVLILLSRPTDAMFKTLASLALGIDLPSESKEQVVKKENVRPKQEVAQQSTTQIERVGTQAEQQSIAQADQGTFSTIHITGSATINLNNNNNNNLAQNTPVTNNVATNTNTNVQTEAHAAAHAQAQSEATAHAYQTMWNDYKGQMSTFWQDNKWYAGASALVGLYGYHFYQVVRGNFYLQRTDLWSSWKRELSFDQLCQIPQQHLARELMMAVQQQGLDVQNPMNFTAPFVFFLQAIEQERNQLLYYQTLHKRITILRCGMIFPFNTKRYKQIDARLQRLSLVKNIFISWMADVNLKHAQSAPGSVPMA